MSHIVTIRTEVRDPAALREACGRLKLPPPELRTAKLFTAEATGYCVELPRWRYPVVCDVDAGKVLFDNYEGRWGDPVELNLLIQGYAVEKAKLEAQKAGYSVYEQPLKDGSVKVTISVGGVA